MSKKVKSRRRSDPPTSVAPTASDVPSASDAGVPRLVWLLLVLLCLSLVAIPVYRWYGTQRSADTGIVGGPAADRGVDRLRSLPTEGTYPTVEELRKEADQISENLLASYPRSVSAVYVAASQAAQLHQYEQAAELWERAIELDPKSTSARAGLARVELEQGHDQRAAEILEAALAAGCESAEIYQMLCQASQKLGDVSRAKSACTAGLRQYKDEAALWFEQGQLQIQLGEIEEAKASLERAAELSPDSVAIYNSLATAVARLGDTEQAKKYRQRYTDLKQQDPLADVPFETIYRASLQKIVVESLRGAAAEYQLQGDHETAEQYLLRVLTLHPEDVPACRLLVHLYRQQVRAGDAHLVQQRLVQFEPTVENLVNLASLAVATQNTAEAESALLAALKVNPQSVPARRSLTILYQHEGHVQQAREQAEQLVRLQPSEEHRALLSQILQQMNTR